MSSFAKRLAYAQVFECEIAVALEARGWVVERYGQALLTDAARRILKTDAHAQHRWLPDLLAYHQEQDVRVLVDAKASGGPNYVIEKASLAALVNHEKTALMPLFIVFHDWAVVRACELWEITDDQRICRTGQPPARGSGTPYWVINCGSLPRTFDNTFGKAT